MTRGLFLGLDAGSVSLDAVLVDASGAVMASAVAITSGRTSDTLSRVIADLARAVPGGRVAGACSTGSGRSLVAGIVGGARLNEITAHARGACRCLPEGITCSLLEMGGQDSKFMEVERHGDAVEVLDYSMNTLCAAGTGVFLDGQAERLGITAEDLGRMAAAAPRAAEVAGRCSVFAKTDIIHHQQRGTPLDELALGLCLAAARNMASALVRGRSIHQPFFFTGGVAASPGMIRAVREILDLRQDMPIVPDGHRILGALGAALVAREDGAAALDPPRWIEEIMAGISQGPAPVGPESGRARRMAEVPIAPPAAASLEMTSPALPSQDADAAAIGFDLGSVSAKWVIVTGGRVMDSGYAFTRGRPVQALAAEFERIRSSEALAGKRVMAIGVTGSGRKLAASLLGADLAINEITAHARSMRAVDPEADTLIEIGGQDAKFVRLDGDAVIDFAMNTACSAGTGSLLLEESVRLGMEVSELDGAAESSIAPADLHARCTVFMDSDLVSRMQEGAKVEDLAAGLLRSVARNYLEKVVGQRAPGERIVFAGGVSRSGVVRRELERILGRPVGVSDWGHLGGAMGAAMIAMEGASPGASHDLAARTVPHSPRTTRPIRCRGCGGSCTVTRMEFTPGADAHPGGMESGGGRDAIRLYTGDACGRWSDGGGDHVDPDAPRQERGGDLFEERARLYGMDRGAPALRDGEIGIPRAHQSWDIAPLCRALLGSLGLGAGISGTTAPETLQQAIALSRSEQCMPLKVGIAHCSDLIDRGARALFLPSIGEYPQDPRLVKPDSIRLMHCIYGQQLGPIVRAALGEKAAAKGVPLVVPHLSPNPALFEVSCRSLREALRPLGDFGARQIEKALHEAVARDRETRSTAESMGIPALDAASRDCPVVVVFGRPYTIYDPVLNLQVVRRLERLGLAAIPYDTILAAGSVPQNLSFVQWKMGSDHLRAARAMASRPHAYPLLLSYYGCGPDAFVSKYVSDILPGRPSLSIELDGHSAEAGIETRLEALADAISRRWRGRTEPRPATDVGGDLFPRIIRHAGEIRGTVVGVPDFGPHANAFAGAFEAAGMEVRMLPRPTDESRLQGERQSDGRECNPHAILLGDLLGWAREGSIPAARKSFFILSAHGPCLMSHYGPSFTRILRRMGAGSIRIWNPFGANLSSVLALRHVAALWQSLLACDYLFRWSTAIRPYEVAPGSTDAALEKALAVVRDGTRRCDVLGAVREAARILASVPNTRDAPGERARRVRVGIIGDIYTRMNPFANQGLYSALESLGCEVLAPPFIVDGQIWDMVDFPKRFWEHHEHRRAIQRGLLSVYQREELWRVRRRFPPWPEITCDAGFLKWRAATEPYLRSDVDGLLAQNLGKAMDFIAMGADGIVNTMCHNCMAGLATDAVFPAVRRDHGGIPYLSLAYDSLGDVHVATRIEAFVDLMRTRRARGAGSPA